MTKKILAFIVAIILLNSVVYAQGDCSPWAKDEVQKAVLAGIVPKELQKAYQNSITRGEFAHIAVTFMNKIKGEELKTASSVFSDTNDTYVNSAYEMGLISGRGDGTFAPDETITRQEAAKVIANTYRAYTGKSIVYGETPEFDDNSDISEWAKTDVGILTYRNIMNGTGENFDPLGLYTREQSIVTFVRLMEYLKGRYKDPEYDRKNTPIADFLHVSGGKLISDGKEVVLKGVNLGGWLIMETWMSPVLDKGEEMAYSDVIRILRERFGEEKTNEIIRGYEDNFITENDFEIIEALGFNCVRIPFWYRNFVNEDGMWLESAFERLDFAIEQCERRGIWVILDMHGCPGGQSMNHSTGTKGVNGLYNNEKNLALMEEIWVEIAKRYKDVKGIAAYDIMNEPQNNKGYSGIRAWKAESKMAVQYTNAVYDRMITAVREYDKNHIISVEGIWTINVLPNPKKFGWENMLYQLHIYDAEKPMIDLRIDEMKDARSNWSVAVMAGEYNSGKLEEYATEAFDGNNISRIKWTYKTMGENLGNWGLYGKNYNKVDIKTADFEEIKKAFGDDVKTENGFEFNKEEYDNIRP